MTDVPACRIPSLRPMAVVTVTVPGKAIRREPVLVWGPVRGCGH